MKPLLSRLAAISWLAAAQLLVLNALATAQTLPIDPSDRPTPVRDQGEGMRDVARTADVGVGEVGQRQTKENAAVNIYPTGRIENRIENRVQNRIRNRIDRTYDPTANATSPFERAENNISSANDVRPPLGL